MSTTKTQEWLTAMGTPKTEEETQWFLACWKAEERSMCGARDQAEAVQYEIANPTTYESIEEDFFELLVEDEENKSQMQERARDFYNSEG